MIIPRFSEVCLTLPLERRALIGNLGKQPWLRPGTEYLIGRSKPTTAVDNRRYGVIEHKSVSRQHLVIKVDLPAAGTGVRYPNLVLLYRY